MNESIKIYQIYYDEQSRKLLDTNFYHLDNSANERPDWREYWPIRKYLLNNRLDENCFYGFFSPKFNQKTNLNSTFVLDFIRRNESQNIDIFIFSPYFDQNAFHQNIFLQAIPPHKEIEKLFECFFKVNCANFDWKGAISDSTNTVFCNFFVAKPNFWIRWLSICECIYHEAENSNSTLFESLNSSTSHRSTTNLNNDAQLKVFIIERMATYLLLVDQTFKTKAYPSFDLPKTNAFFKNQRSALAQMDALKIAYKQTGNNEYLDLFFKIQSLLIKEHG